MIPNNQHPSLPAPSVIYSEQLQNIDRSTWSPSTITPLESKMESLTPLIPTRKTQLMSVVNVTPDSFSDGGLHSVQDMPAFERTIQAQIDGGATIIDVGGQSTRPKAEDVGEAEETRRVIPAIQKIRNMLQAQQLEDRISISIDTYRAGVARYAVQSGASIVNDVSAGTLDPKMLQTVAEIGCSVILMHMRGDPANMSSPEHTYYPEGLVKTIGAELSARIDAADAAGIRRWRIILDPGIGFAKTGAQNLEILRSFCHLREDSKLKGLPWVVGTSRKAFLGKICGIKEPRERVWGTAAAVAAAIQGGADVVRVHDVEEMGQVTKVADAIWRGDMD